VNPDPTTTTLSPSTSSLLFGQQLMLTATVSANPPGSGIPTGTVTFTDGGGSLGTAALDGTGRASLSTSTLLAGPHTLSAVYGGDGNYVPSTSPAASVTVGFSGCITGSRAGPLTVTAGQAECITGTVAGPVSVQPGGALAIIGGTISGPITITGATAVAVCGARISGSLSVKEASGPVLIGDAGDEGSGCAANTISGPVTLTGNIGGLELGGNTISGPVTVSGNGGGIPPEGSAAEIGQPDQRPARLYRQHTLAEQRRPPEQRQRPPHRPVRHTPRLLTTLLKTRPSARWSGAAIYAVSQAGPGVRGTRPVRTNALLAPPHALPGPRRSAACRRHFL
jgi:hypothetical protein